MTLDVIKKRNFPSGWALNGSKKLFIPVGCVYMEDFTPVTNGVIYSSRLSYMEDFTPVTNGVIYSSRLSYMEDFTPVTNGVISSSR